MVGWVFFRIEGLPQALHYIKTMFAFKFDASSIAPTLEFKAMLAVAVFISFVGVFSVGSKLQNIVYSTSGALRWYVPMLVLSFVVYILCVSAITTASFNPFIYFRF